MTSLSHSTLYDLIALSACDPIDNTVIFMFTSLTVCPSGHLLVSTLPLPLLCVLLTDLNPVPVSLLSANLLSQKLMSTNHVTDCGGKGDEVGSAHTADRSEEKRCTEQ